MWNGADADDFPANWASTHDPAVRRALAELRTMAEVIRRNRDEQIVAGDAGPPQRVDHRRPSSLLTRPSTTSIDDVRIAR